MIAVTSLSRRKIAEGRAVIIFRISANISDAFNRDLTVTGVNVGERPETRDLGI
jgi:hypothetical protein